MNKYQSDAEFKKLVTLAFIPLEHVTTVYEDLGDSFEDDELPVLTCFETTFIVNVIDRRGSRFPPHFPHKMWNIVGRHKAGYARLRVNLYCVYFLYYQLPAFYNKFDIASLIDL